MELYLVALLAPEPIKSEVWELKQEVQRRTGSRNATRLPPHITLVPPLRQPPEFEAQAAAALRTFAATQAACPLHLHDFAWFQNRTLYVRVIEQEPLQQLHAALYRWCAVHLPTVPKETRPFVPHMTLATRDLPPNMVPELRQDFASRTYRASAELRELVLYRHDGRVWQERELVRLGEPTPPA
ncbi:2'-5' RNA ligase family protein [Hymenobacter tenuis]